MSKTVFEIRTDFLKDAPYDEEVVGCYVHNFGSPSRCCGFQSSGCKSLKRCEALQRMERRARDEQTK